MQKSPVERVLGDGHLFPQASVVGMLHIRGVQPTAGNYVWVYA